VRGALLTSEGGRGNFVEIRLNAGGVSSRTSPEDAFEGEPNVKDRRDVVVALNATQAAARRMDAGGNARRVAIVVPHNLIRAGLERVVAAGTSSRVVAAVADPADLDVAATRPDVIVLGMPGHVEDADIETLSDLARHGRVLVLVDQPDSSGLINLLRAGAHGCVTGYAEDAEVLRALEAVACGGFHVSPGLSGRMREELCRPETTVTPVLGRRETETLRLLATGLTHHQVARRMGLTDATVNTYVKRIRGKLDAGNKADLTRVAMEWGLLDEPVAEPARRSG
jgi:DNA-binding NarL/FixJ family response regulator